MFTLTLNVSNVPIAAGMVWGFQEKWKRGQSLWYRMTDTPQIVLFCVVPGLSGLLLSETSQQGCGGDPARDPECPDVRLHLRDRLPASGQPDLQRGLQIEVRWPLTPDPPTASPVLKHSAPYVLYIWAGFYFSSLSFLNWIHLFTVTIYVQTNMGLLVYFVALLM